jgi:hypothetical protein
LTATNDSLLGSDFAWIPSRFVGAGTHYVRVSHRSSHYSPQSRGHYHIQALYGQPVTTAPADERPLLADIRYESNSQQLHIHIQRCTPGSYRLHVYDLQGRTHLASALSVQTSTLHAVALPSLPSGLYIAELAGSRQSFRQKVFFY